MDMVDRLLAEYVYVCVCVCVYVCVCVCVWVFVCVCVCSNRCKVHNDKSLLLIACIERNDMDMVDRLLAEVCVCVFNTVYVCVFVCICVFTHIHTYTYTRGRRQFSRCCTRRSTALHDMHTYIYTHIHTHIYIHRGSTSIFMTLQGTDVRLCMSL